LGSQHRVPACVGALLLLPKLLLLRQRLLLLPLLLLRLPGPSPASNGARGAQTGCAASGRQTSQRGGSGVAPRWLGSKQQQLQCCHAQAILSVLVAQPSWWPGVVPGGQWPKTTCLQQKATTCFLGQLVAGAACGWGDRGVRGGVPVAGWLGCLLRGGHGRPGQAHGPTWMELQGESTASADLATANSAARGLGAES
jgi:hypothetical protein